MKATRKKFEGRQLFIATLEKSKSWNFEWVLRIDVYVLCASDEAETFFLDHQTFLSTK